MKQKRKQLPEKQQPTDGKMLQWHPAFMPTCRLNSEKNQLYQAVMEIIVKANENQLKEGKRDMCNALLELMKDELDEKREEGIREGESLGVNRINQLILKLSELNRTDDILKAAADREYQKKLLKEFGL